MFWTVVGGVALAIGVTLTLMTIPNVNLGASNVELAGILLGIGGITIGSVIAYFQNKQARKMDNILSHIRAREDKRKKYYLIRIVSYTQIIKKHFDNLVAHIDKYEKESIPANWNIVTNHSKFAFDQIGELGKVVKNDFDHIFDLIELQYLSDKYDDVNVYLSQFVFGDVIRTNPRGDGLIELKKTIAEHISKLDFTLKSINEEMPKDEK